MSFNLTGKEDILIYGAGERGKKLAELFYENGFHVKAILDQKAAGLGSVTVKNHIFQVVHPEEYSGCPENEIIIISLWNAVQHEMIAKYLNKMGFTKIIYIPMTMMGNIELMSQMRTVFNDILEDRIFVHAVPEYREIVEKPAYQGLNGDLVYLPVELLFSEENFEIPIENLNDSEYLKRKKVLQTSGENIGNMKHYLQLYQYLDKGCGDCTDYLSTQISDLSGHNEAEKKRVLKDRYTLFQIYEKAFGINRELFYDSAPTVTWNPKGYFNIIDGHHRATYMYYKGIWDIPVKVLEADKIYLKMLDNIPKSFMSESTHLVEVENSLSWRKMNAIICSALRKKDIDGSRVYTNLNDAGYIARYCCRIGSKQCIDIEKAEKYDFAMQLCDLFQYGNSMKIETSIGALLGLDVAIVDEECIDDFAGVRASRYIIKLRKHGMLHEKILRKGLTYKRIGENFDGEKEYLVIQMEEKSVCSL